ncbi:hypothetical protein D3C84_989300 [compost metagenome]
MEKLGAEPMLVLLAQGSTLAILWTTRILRDDLECQFQNGRKALAGILPYVTFWILPAQGFYLLGQPLDLLKKQRMGKYSPAVDD